MTILAEESYTIKEILNEMRIENRDSFDKINSHLAQLNSKVAAHVQQISALEQETALAEARLKVIEKDSIRFGVIISVVVFVAAAVANIIFNKFF